MKNVLIIGSGISGLTCAIESAKLGNRVILASPYPSERSQSVMAAGGINAALNTKGEKDSPKRHYEDTINGGRNIASKRAVKGLCESAPSIISWLESLGTVFSRDKQGMIDLRAFGGQSCKRTAFAGASTGKQIVSALTREALKYECMGLIERRVGLYFHSALLSDGICFGALFYNQISRKLETIFADAVVMATGGQNGLFGKTTGSVLCDGYAEGKLFSQGAQLKNLEFIQYHPTTIETSQKRILITEGARGEGGRLYYLDGDRRVYFMEDKFGKNGNLMPRDVVSKCIYDAPSQVYLDITHLGKKTIMKRLFEVYSTCKDYAGIDVTKESIPVSTSVHFFMGGLSVDIKHRTNLSRLYAIGECASIYHGANRLGGNSLLAAVYSGKIAATSINKEKTEFKIPDFKTYISKQEKLIFKSAISNSKLSSIYVIKELANIMNENLGVTRTEKKLKNGLDMVDYYLSNYDRINFENETTPYHKYRLKSMLNLAKAILISAEKRSETRGAHIREDYPESNEMYRKATVISYNAGRYEADFVEEDII